METKQEMLKVLQEAGYPRRMIAERTGISAPTLLQWERGGVCRDPESFARLRKFYVNVCEELGVKHD